MNAKGIRAARKEACKELEQTGGITNSAYNLLTSVDELQCRLAKIGEILKNDLVYSFDEIEAMRELTEI